METLKEIKKGLQDIEISSSTEIEESIRKMKEFLSLVRTLRIELEGTLSDLANNINNSQRTLLETEKRRDEVAAEYDKISKEKKEIMSRFDSELESKKNFADELDVKITRSSKLVDTLNAERTMVVESISAAQIEVSKAQAEIKSLEKEKSVVQNKVDELTDQCAKLEQQKDELSRDLGTKKNDVVILEKRLKELKN